MEQTVLCIEFYCEAIIKYFSVKAYLNIYSAILLPGTVLRSRR